MSKKVEEDYSNSETVPSNATILFITGLPCTGKTFLGKQIAAHFSLPYIYKDGIKEELFDTLGWSDRSWSKKLGAAAYSILFYISEALLEAGKSFILESNFSAERDNPRLQKLQEKYNYRAIEIQCVADGEIIVERFRKRWETGTRHPGHVDPETYDELHQTLLQGSLPPLGLKGDYIEMDTSDFETINVGNLIRKIEQKISIKNKYCR
jgi:predicted kinase